MELPKLIIDYPGCPYLRTTDGIPIAKVYHPRDAVELARRSNLFPRLVEALEDCLSDADALLSASDGDYARPDEGLVANGKTILAEIRQSEQERKGAKHDPK